MTTTWIDPEATGDDRTWRETCGSNEDDPYAPHEPEEDDAEDEATCRHCQKRIIDADSDEAQAEELQEKLDALDYEEIIEMFRRGVDDYTGGVAPDGWDHPRARENPYLAGWNAAAESENGIKFFNANDEEVPRVGLDE